MDVLPHKSLLQDPTKKFNTLIKELVFRTDIFCLLKTTFNSSNRKNILVVWSEQKMKGNQLSILITYCIIIQTYKIFCPACSWNYPVLGGKTKCQQTNKLPTERLAFCPFFLWLAFCPSQFLDGIMSGPSQHVLTFCPNHGIQFHHFYPPPGSCNLFFFAVD